MQTNYYTYEKPQTNFSIWKMPIWFQEKTFDGDNNTGHIVLETQNEYDDIWGSLAKMEISWEKKKRLEYHHAKEVQKSIDIYNAIKVAVSNKETTWVRSHEFTIWHGQRMKMIRKRVYNERSIHGIFYCEITERQFDLHCAVIREHFDGFKPYIIDAYNSMLCH